LTKHRFIFSLLIGLVLLSAPAAATLAQQPVVTDDEVKVNTYKRFVDNRVPNPAVAYEAARDYMARYGKENDQYTKYLKDWMTAWEEDERVRKAAADRADREQQLLGSFTQKDYAKAYGLAKQVLADDQDNVRVLVALGVGALNASTEARNEAFNNDASKYAEKAIRLIEGGKSPETWVPFKSKEDTLGSLYYALGFYLLKTTPESAATNFIKASQVDADRRNSPTTYSFLALAYQNGAYKRLSEDYSKRFANQPESPEGKAALDNINKVVDRIIDGYARAVALAGSSPQNQTAKAQWLAQLTNFYKFRHENSDAGLTEFIANVMKTPLPQP
jgi:hypothetical protein